MEKCRIILAEQDNLLTFSESQERCHLGLRRLIGSRLSSRPPRWDSAELSWQSRIISSPSQNLQDRCHLSLRRLIGLRPFFFPTSKMEKCRIILAEQDNLLTFSESQERCHLGLRRLIGSRLSSRPPRWDSAELS
ncbi:hypothetical protein GQ457_07G006560 [Hibiscus cannabinus]